MLSGKNLKGVVSLRYALALFELAKEQQKLDVVEKEIKSILTLIEESSDFSRFIFNSIFSKRERISVIKSFAESAKLSSLTRNFLYVLVNKERINILPDVSLEFIKITAREKGEVWANVVVTNDITEEQISKIKQIVIAATAMSSVRLEIITDKNIIGGLVIRFGSVLIDNSVKSKLDRLKNKLSNISSFSSSDTREVG